MKTINFYGVITAILFLVGCVSAPPQDTISRVQSDLAGATNCIEMFKALPVDCKENPSYCVDLDFFNKNRVSYQDAAQTMNAVFTVARYDENNSVAICTWNKAGTMRGWKYLESATLAACEKQRLTYMSKNDISLKSCEVYARGNEIQ